MGMQRRRLALQKFCTCRLLLYIYSALLRMIKVIDELRETVARGVKTDSHSLALIKAKTTSAVISPLRNPCSPQVQPWLRDVIHLLTLSARIHNLYKQVQQNKRAQVLINKCLVTSLIRCCCNQTLAMIKNSHYSRLFLPVLKSHSSSIRTELHNGVGAPSGEEEDPGSQSQWTGKRKGPFATPCIRSSFSGTLDTDDTMQHLSSSVLPNYP